MINRSPVIQVEICTICNFNCSGCTRAIQHRNNNQFHDLDYIEKAICSLQYSKHIVGCFGGEPTIHPNFPEICRLYQKYLPKNRCGLWTSGGKEFQTNKTLIEKTFGIINYNSHSKKVFHQPPLLSSKLLVHNEKER